MYTLKQLKKKKIGVFLGGFSREREISIRSGENVLEALKRLGLNATKVDPSINGISDDIDIAYIVLHGKYGEDGALQGLLEMKKIPYTGPGVLASALAMNKVMTKRVLNEAGVNTPLWQTMNLNGKAKIKTPLMVKPFSEGSSIGVTLVKNNKDVKKVLNKTRKIYGKVFIEKYIEGNEVTVGILGYGKKLKVLPILMLRPKNEFYDYEAKYTSGKTDFLLPAPLPKKAYKLAEKEAMKAYGALGCRGVSRVDMIVDKKGIPFVLDINTIPGMTVNSDLPAQAKAIGMTFEDLVLEILSQAALDSDFH